MTRSHASRYERAEALLPGHEARLVKGGVIEPRFACDSDSFRFELGDSATRQTAVLVNPDSGEYVVAPVEDEEPLGPEWSVSPDRQWAVRVRDGNVFLLHRASGSERPLTADGSRERPYATRLDWFSWMLRIRELPESPVIVWSPDSKRFAMERLDQSGVGETHLLQVTDDPRARLISFRNALPGDERWATSALHVVDVTTGTVTAAEIEPLPVSMVQPMLFGQVWFSPRGDRLEAVQQGRDQRRLRIVAVDPVTGRARVAAEQAADTVVDPSPLWWEEPPAARVLDDGRVVWVSERDGWSHLWLVEGERWRQLTRGPWVVREILHIDEDRKEVCFSASGRERDGSPLDRRIYRVDLDGGEPVLLTPEPVDHSVTVSPSGRWFVDNSSSPQVPPVSSLRDASSGAVLRELSRADISGLRAAGWRAPEPFTVRSADRAHDLYGLLFLPSDFDESRRWPLLDVVYPGPQVGIVPRRFGLADSLFDSFAALGLVVIALDARGTPLRSRRFRDFSYGALESSHAIDDHAAAVGQLAERHPWIDASRVGILGNSGGGYMTVRALIERPETFSVGVSAVGNHDSRRYQAGWGERYIGPVAANRTAWESQSTIGLVHRLRGKLLLGVSELDANVDPACSRALIDALIEADVDHEVLLLPGGDHVSCATSPYYVRRVWDFLMRNLIGEEPVGYSISPRSLATPEFR